MRPFQGRPVDEGRIGYQRRYLLAPFPGTCIEMIRGEVLKVRVEYIGVLEGGTDLQCTDVPRPNQRNKETPRNAE